MKLNFFQIGLFSSILMLSAFGVSSFIFGSKLKAISTKLDDIEKRIEITDSAWSVTDSLYQQAYFCNDSVLSVKYQAFLKDCACQKGQGANMCFWNDEVMLKNFRPDSIFRQFLVSKLLGDGKSTLCIHCIGRHDRIFRSLHDSIYKLNYRSSLFRKKYLIPAPKSIS